MWGSKKSLAHRLALSVSGIMVAALTAVSVGGFWMQHAQRHQQLDTSATTMAHHLAVALALPLWSGQLQAVNDVLDSAMETRDIAGLVVCMTNAPTAAGLRTFVRSRDADWRAVDRATSWQPREIITRGAITHAGVHVGTLEVACTARWVDRQFKQTVFCFVGAMVFLFILLSVSLYLLLHVNVVTPLRLIEAFADNVIANKGKAVVECPRGSFCSELDRLKIALESMVDLLQERFATLAQSENRLRVAFNMASEAHVLVHMDTGQLIDVNDSFCAMFGFSHDELIGHTTHDLRMWGDPADRVNILAALAEGQGKLYNRETVARRRTGETFPVLYSATVLANTQPPLMHVILRDIEEQSKLERERKRSDAFRSRLIAIIESSEDAIISKSLDGIIVSWNRGAEKLFGYSATEVVGKSILLLFPAERVDEEQDIRARINRGMIIKNLDTVRVTKDGRRINVSVTISPLRDSDGNIIGASKIVRDITELRQSEERIYQLNRVYAMLSEINQLIVRERDMAVLLDMVCKMAIEKGQFIAAYIDAQQGLRDLLGPIPAEGFGKCLGIGCSQPKNDCSFISRVWKTGQYQVCNDVEADVNMVPCCAALVQAGCYACAAFPLKVDHVTIGVLMFYAREKNVFDAEELRLLSELSEDISFALSVHRQEVERRLAESQWRESEARFQQVVENIQEVFWMTDIDKTQVLYVSPAFEKIWGYACESLYKDPSLWLKSIHRDEQERVSQAFVTLQKTGRYSEVYRIVRADGAERWIHDQAFIVTSPSDHIQRIVGTAEDITDRRGLEEQLRQAQKMEAVGQLAGGVAHDFNNILAAIMMQTQFMEEAPALTPEVADGLQEILTSTRRAANLTRQLLLFSRKQVMQPRNLDLNEIVTNIAKMLQRLIGATIQLRLNLHPAALIAFADPGMIDQVVMNLVVNARDAMPRGGLLRIETRAVDVSPAMIPGGEDAVPGHYVGFNVVDTGVGIPPENIAKIFEPFFTTKEVGKGTGLGLATVFGIVRQHRGFVKVSSVVGEGTTFSVYLPAAQNPVQVNAKDREQRQGGSETILLVEDDDTLRTVTRSVLVQQGYKVFEAVNGVEAVKIWELHQDEIALLLTDLVMPAGLSGMDVAKRLRQDRPSLKIIFVSGYSADLAGKPLDLKLGENFLQKPFDAHVLLAVIRQNLDAVRT